MNETVLDIGGKSVLASSIDAVMPTDGVPNCIVVQLPDGTWATAPALVEVWLHNQSVLYGARPYKEVVQAWQIALMPPLTYWPPETNEVPTT